MTPRPFRLSLAQALEPFRPELEFACDYLRRRHGLAPAPAADLVLHAGPDAPAGAVAVPAALFPDGATVAADGVRLARGRMAAIEPRLLPPSLDWDAGPNPLDYDALGLLFLTLSRIEEREAPECAEDRYGRYPYAASFQARRAGPLVPLADIAARDLAAALLRTPAPPQPAYSVRLTHDMDLLRGCHRPLDPLRPIAVDLLKRRDPAAALKRARKAWFSGEPWRSLDFILERNERKGLPGHFFFMGPSLDPFDSPYAAREPGTLAKVAARVLERGHRVGLHPGKGTHRDGALLQNQKAALERIVGRELTEARQHGLLLAAEDSFDLLSEAGITDDHTLGWPAPSALRSGATSPHATYSLRRRRTLPLVEHPTAVMDFDMMAESYARSFGAPVAILRPFNAFGPRQSERAVIPTTIRQALDPACPAIRLGDLSPRRDFTFVADTAAAFAALGAADAVEFGRPYNAGTGRAVTIGEMVETVRRISGANKPVAADRERLRPEASEVRALLADSRAIEAAAGWRAKVGFEEGLAKTVEWWRERLAAGRVRPGAGYAV